MSGAATSKMLFTHEILTQISSLWRRLIELISAAFKFQTAEGKMKGGRETGIHTVGTVGKVAHCATECWAHFKANPFYTCN